MKFTDVGITFKKNYLYILIILAVVLLVNRNLLINPFDPPTGIDMLGWIAATSYLSNTFNFIYAWLNYSFGVSGSLSQLYIILAGMNLLIQNSVLTVKIYILIAFLVAGISMYITTYFFTLNRLSGLISALVFILNPLFIGLVGSGHLNTVLVYSFGPILFLSLYHAIEKKNITSIILFSFITVLMLVARLDQFLYYGLFVGLYCVFTIFISKEIKKMTLNVSQVLLASILFVAMFGMIFFLPIIMGTNPPYFGVRTLLIQRLEWYSSNFYEALLGIPTKSFIPIISQIHFPQDPPHYNVNYLLIPTVFAYSAVLFKKDKLTLFLTFSALLSVLLATGSKPFFGDIYSWMWLNLPYFEIFSVPSRWLIITHFSYSILIGITINEISKRFQTRNLNKNLTRILIGALIGSIFLGNWFAIGNGLQTWKFSRSEVEAYTYVSNQSGDFRVLPVPFAREVMETKWGLLRDLGFESSLFHGKEVVRTGEGVRYSKEFINYWDALMLTNKTNNLPKILGGFNVKYIILSERLTTWDTPQGVNPEYQHTFFKNQKGLKPVYTSGNATVYENEYWTPRIFAAYNSAIIVGGREALTALAEVDEFKFSDWALFFAAQVIRENGKETFIELLNKSDALIFVNSEPLDLAMLLLGNATRIKAAEYAYPSIDAKEHWVRSDSATKTGMFVLNYRTLSTSGENNVSIPVKLEKDGRYEVWARVVYYKDRGELSLSIDGREIGKIVPYSPTRIKWVKLGDVDLSKGKHTLVLQNKKSAYGMKNDIDEIILVDPKELEAKMSEVNRLIEKSNRIVFIAEKQRMAEITKSDLSQKLGFPELKYQISEFKDYLVFYSLNKGEKEIRFPEIFEVSEPSPEVNFTKINPTKYEIRIKTDKPFFLIFSDSYHPLWKAYLDNEEIESIISYSFINGFYVQKTGEYDVTIEFIGQRYVWIGGIISLTTFVFAIVYILFENRILQIVKRLRKKFYAKIK